MGLSFTIDVSPRQRSHFHVPVPRDSWPHFTVSDSRLPQPGGSGPCIYIPQEKGGPVIPPGTGFLRLAGLRWRYSTPPLHGINSNTQLTPTLYSPGTNRTENASSIIACSLAAGETCAQSCFLATAVVMSPVYRVVTWQWVYKSQYDKMDPFFQRP
jgi:hypothetical protein